MEDSLSIRNDVVVTVRVRRPATSQPTSETGQSSDQKRESRDPVGAALEDAFIRLRIGYTDSGRYDGHCGSTYDPNLDD